MGKVWGNFTKEINADDASTNQSQQPKESYFSRCSSTEINLLGRQSNDWHVEVHHTASSGLSKKKLDQSNRQNVVKLCETHWNAVWQDNQKVRKSGLKYTRKRDEIIRYNERLDKSNSIKSRQQKLKDPNIVNVNPSSCLRSPIVCVFPGV